MSLTIKHLNGDASFLLTFQPMLPFPPSPELLQKNAASHSFTLLLDPWLGGRSDIWHPRFSTSTHRNPPCVSSVLELPEPDVVVVSQSKSDHCHRETLTQLPPHPGKTLILAEPAAAKTIKSWKHFAKDKLVTLPKWNEPRPGKPEPLYRISLPPLDPEGEAGEVTIAYMEERGDFTGLHSAIGITYKAPTSSPFPPATTETEPITPPDTPSSSSTFLGPAGASTANRPLSVIFSPHGCTYATISSYCTSHLLTTSALPLTALLHCFDQIRNAWYLGGQICNGFPGGLEIAQKLFAKVWISAHDGDKDVSGLATKKLAIQKFDREDVERVVSPKTDRFSDELGTRAVVLEVGEEICLSQKMHFGLLNDRAFPRSASELDSQASGVCNSA